MLPLRAPVTPLNQQLVLWPEGHPFLLHLAPEASSIAPQQLWATLSPTMQTQTRQMILHILQEVLHDHSTS
jgi:hypothetical protein